MTNYCNDPCGCGRSTMLSQGLEKNHNIVLLYFSKKIKNLLSNS